VEPAEDQFGLRLAANAADRSKTAAQKWPAVEERLRNVGYGPRAIAHAFRALSGPGTVADALKALNDASQHAPHPVPLSFEAPEFDGEPSAASGVTITSVVRHDCGIRANFDFVSRIAAGSREPLGEARDDLGNDYRNLGSHFGLTSDGWRGGLMMPLPPLAATVLRIRITWNTSLSSSGDGRAHEVRVSLRG
jgi:hypothetical protein